MKVKTRVGTVNTDLCGRGKYAPVSYAILSLTFRAEDGSMHSLELRKYGPQRRSDLSAAWVKNAVDEALARDDVSALTLVGVDVKAVESVWSTPYEDIYGKDEVTS